LAALWGRLWSSAKRRKAASLAIALGLEALILLMLLTLGAQIVGEEDGAETVTKFEAVEFAAPRAPAGLTITRLEDGGLRIDAPPELAGALADAFTLLADALRRGASA